MVNLLDLGIQLEPLGAGEEVLFHLSAHINSDGDIQKVEG